MEREPDGGWRIDGVSIERGTSQHLARGRIETEKAPAGPGLFHLAGWPSRTAAEALEGEGNVFLMRLEGRVGASGTI